MNALQGLAIFVAGAAAGAINTVVGSGTLITFPVLLAFGYPPLVANVSNTIGLIPGSLSGAAGYRGELRGQRRRALPLAAASLAGAVMGALLLLMLPAAAFRAIVPIFIGLALLLIVLQPALTARLQARRLAAPRHGGPWVLAGVLLSGVYGGYFGAAQGILLLSVLGLAYADTLQRINGLKVVLAGLVNLTAGIIFAFAAHVSWTAAGLVAAGSVLGGAVGARVGRRLAPSVLRAVIVAVGAVAIVRLL